VEDGALCGVFDGHGNNGHIVSKLVNSRLPSLILSQKKALTQINAAADDHHNFQNHEIVPSKSFHIWKEACIGAFKVMDKEIKLQENLDFSCSGTTAVVVIRQVKRWEYFFSGHSSFFFLLNLFEVKSYIFLFL
jgi:serine/threonine protein phosphatase PrpC